MFDSSYCIALFAVFRHPKNIKIFNDEFRLQSLHSDIPLRHALL